jgi:SAM-dependent methyltransferase
MGENEWWRSFFSGVVVEAWLRATANPEETRPEVDFIEKALGLSPAARVLDVPCGGGRHALEVAARGYAVTAVDYSAEMLAAARAQALKRGVTVDWQEREMRDLPWPGAFDGVYCFGNSFGYLEDEGNAAFLAAVARVLKPGARFILETDGCAESLLPAFQERSWYDLGETLFLNNNRYDHVRGRLETEDIIIRNGQVDRRPGFQRVYTYSELCRLLREAGFATPEGFASVSQEPYHLGAQRLILVAPKNAL